MQARSGSGVTVGMKLSPEQEALHRERDATVIVTAPCGFWDRRSPFRWSPFRTALRPVLIEFGYIVKDSVGRRESTASSSSPFHG